MDERTLAQALRAAANILDPPPVVSVGGTGTTSGSGTIPITTAPPPTVSLQIPAVTGPLAEMYVRAQITQAHLGEVQRIAARIAAHKGAYSDVEKATGVPWYVVGCIHSLEGDLDFTTHLYNGDPLSRRTVHEPSGQPSSGSPPFSWTESAIGALHYDKLDVNKDWSVQGTLDHLERYNGLGYRQRGVPSPYLWSFTNEYTGGKFIADHDYDAHAVSDQAGAAALLKALELTGQIVWSQES